MGRLASGSEGERGATIILVAAMLVVLLGCTAGAVDVGFLDLTRRQLQVATDAAALAAAFSPDRAADIAGESLSSNGFGPAELVAATAGAYQPDPTLPASERFTPGSGDPNAVQVQTSVQAPLFFLRALLPQSSATISATATATRIDQAGFTAGTGLVSLNGGLANAVLGKMLGTSISLSAVSYQGLVDTDINALDFLNALATQLDLTAGTYNQVLNANVTTSTILAAEIAALQSEGQGGQAADALDALQTLQAETGGGASFTLSSLIGDGVDGDQQVGSTAPGTAVTAGLNLYQLTSLSAQIANGSNALALGDALDIPGIATVDLTMTAIEPAQPSAPAIEVGPVGTSVHTAQVRLLLTITLLDSVPLLGNAAVVTLPVYVEIASGNATLQAIDCGTQPATDTTVTISAQPSAASVYVAQINPSVMTDFTTPVPTGTPATLVNLAGLLTVTGKASLVLGSGGSTALTFTQAEMTASPPESQTVASSGMTENLVDTLGSSLQLQASVLGLPVLPLVTQGLAGTVAAALAPVFAQLDSLIDPVLATLGIQVGYMTVTASGAQCGVPVLVL
jgi:uncharacterized membrane protein